MLTPFEVERWRALIQFDDEIRPIAEELARYGDAWVLEFGRAFFALHEDRSYLSNISNGLIEAAQHEQARLTLVAEQELERKWMAAFTRTAQGEVTSSESLRILREAEKSGYTLTVEANGTFVVSKGSSHSYLRSDYDIRQFGKYHVKQA